MGDAAAFGAHLHRRHGGRVIDEDVQIAEASDGLDEARPFLLQSICPCAAFAY